MTDDSAAVRGYIYGYRSTADGSLVVTVELDEFEARVFHDSNMTKGIAVAIVRMNNDGSAETRS